MEAGGLELLFAAMRAHRTSGAFQTQPCLAVAALTAHALAKCSTCAICQEEMIATTEALKLPCGATLPNRLCKAAVRGDVLRAALSPGGPSRAPLVRPRGVAPSLLASRASPPVADVVASTRVRRTGGN